MNKNLLSITLLAAAAASVHAAGLKAATISWAKAYPTAKSLSTSSGKLMMIDFYTDWCGWCKKLDADTYPAPEVVAESEKFVPVKLNAEKDADGIRLAKKFKIDGYPTILFIDGNENLVYKVVGYEPAKDFAASMDKAASVRQDTAKFKAELAKNPNDVTALLGLASVDASLGDADEAADLVNKAAALATPAQKGDLLKGYNSVGDTYQNSQKLAEAIPYFQKAIDDAFPDQEAYARISIAACLLQSGKAKDAIPYLEALLKMGTAADTYRAEAKQMLDFANKPATKPTN